MKQKLPMRLLACLLCLVALLPLVACSNQDEEVPEGMRDATCAGDAFRLYVPLSWYVNTAGGTSSAYYSADEQSTVSVVGYTITETMTAELAEKQGEERLLWFFDTQIKPTLNAIADGTVEAITEDAASTMLGDAAAYQLHHKLALDGKDQQFLHVVAERGDSFYVFSFTALESQYNALYADDKTVGDVAQILAEFRFADAGSVPSDDKLIADDITPPEGMKNCFGKHTVYCFFVPLDWTVNVKNGIYSATSADGSAVASVTVFVPTTDIASVEAYVNACADQLKTIDTSCKFIGGTDDSYAATGSLGAYEGALVLEYEYTVNGTLYHGKQITVGRTDNVIYSVTYTARAEDYTTHLADAERIFAEFTFR